MSKHVVNYEPSIQLFYGDQRQYNVLLVVVKSSVCTKIWAWLGVLDIEYEIFGQSFALYFLDKNGVLRLVSQEPTT
jgi:hypothetical protein